MGVSLEKMKNPLPVTQEAFCDFVWGNREVLDEMFKEAKEAREEGIEVGVAICEEDGALFLGERSKIYSPHRALSERKYCGRCPHSHWRGFARTLSWGCGRVTSLRASFQLYN